MGSGEWGVEEWKSGRVQEWKNGERCSGGAGAEDAAVEVEEDEEGDEGAGGVKERIPGGGGAGSDEGLMDFVEGGIGGGDEPRAESPGPVPATTRAANATVEKKEKDEVLDEMGAFANEEMNGVELVFG